ncbi:hypothetical protein [Wolbachia endosymbiont (group A) of Anomoia purmunda]|uniref:hypothetical protein n=1 Tax=Wolbachia endosymbiont (group A) of Anomoia purmunda TaxID=2953978 RepID=UPI00222E102E|nr:hypothetical protein [Wolbachia endosymbiont (group A) of Anomoia purmunda]
MVASDSVLKRYALAYIKKSGNNIEGFLQHCNNTPNLTWSEENFKNVYEKFPRSNSNDSLSFWDYLLLQFWIDSLFGGRGHTTVNNITNINNSNSNAFCQSEKDKKKDSEDSRKLLALGIVAAVVCVVFHASMCFWYHSSRKTARKEEKIDYLDNKLKMLRNIEFAVGAVFWQL